MPQFNVTAPTGKTYTVNAPEGATQADVIQYVQQQVGPAKTPQTDMLSQLSNATPKKGLIDSFTSSIGRGIDRAGITLGDELPALLGSALGQDDYARRQLEEAELSRANLEALNPTQVKSYKDIGGVGDFLTYAAESIGENIPNIIGIAGGTGVAAFGARKLAGSAIKKKIKNQAIGSAQDRLKEQLVIAQTQAGNQAIMPAAFLGSYALNAPEVFSNIYDATGELAPAAALLTGSVSAALDSILPTMVVKRLRANPALKAKVVAEAMKKSGTRTEVLGAIGLGAGKGFALEGVTESTQEALSLAAERIVGENYEALTSEDFDRLIESGLRGALAGGAFGAAGGTQEGLQVRSAALARQAQPPSGTTDVSGVDAETNVVDAKSETPNITNTTELIQTELDLSTGNEAFDKATAKLQIDTVKGREKIQTEIEKIQNKKDTPSRTAALKAQQKILDTFEKTQQEKYTALEEEYKIYLSKQDPQSDLFAQQRQEQQGVPEAPRQSDLFPETDANVAGTTDADVAGTTDADVAGTTDADVAGTTDATEDSEFQLDRALMINKDSSLTKIVDGEKVSLTPEEVDSIQQGTSEGFEDYRSNVFNFDVFNKKLKDNKKTYTEFKKTLEPRDAKNTPNSGYQALDRIGVSGVNELVGDILNAVVEGDTNALTQFVVNMPKTLEKNQTIKQAREAHLKKTLTDNLFRRLAKDPTSYGRDNLEDTQLYRNQTKTGSDYGVAYYKKLSTAKKKEVKDKVREAILGDTRFTGEIRSKTSKVNKGITPSSFKKLTAEEKITANRYNAAIEIKNRLENKRYTEGSLTEEDNGKLEVAKTSIDELGAELRLVETISQQDLDVQTETLAGQVVSEQDTDAQRTKLKTQGELELAEARGEEPATPRRLGDLPEDSLSDAERSALRINAIKVAQDRRTLRDLDEKENELNPDDVIEINAAWTVVGDVDSGPKGPPLQSDEYADRQESVNIGEVTTPTTVEETTARLAELNIDVSNNARVSITPTPEDAGLDSSRLSNGVKAVVIKDKAYLFTNNIQRGNEVGVFLHELGGHIGMVNLVGRENYNFLTKRIKQFAANNDGSREHDIAKAAVAHIQDIEKATGKKLNQEIKDHETLAYFIEIAVQNGTKPSEISRQQSKLGIFFRRLLAGIKSFLRKYGKIESKNLDAQSIVDLAYGGAQLAMRAPNKKLDFLTSELLFSQASSANAVYDMQTKLLGVANDIIYDEKYAVAVDGISKGTGVLANMFYGALSFDQLIDHANRSNPFLASQIKKLGELVALKRAKTDEYNRDISEYLVRVNSLQNEAAEGLSEVKQLEIKDEFNDITHQSSINQVDLRKPRNVLEQEAADNNTVLSVGENALISRFENLPPQMQESYNIIINTYERYGNLLLDNLDGKLTGVLNDTTQPAEVLSAVQKLKKQLESNRIVPYVPLLREGEYWIDLELSNGEPYTETFKTETEANRALADMKKEIASAKGETYTITRAVYKRLSGLALRDMSGQAQAYQQVLQLLSSIDSPKGGQALEQHKELYEKVVKSYYEAFPSNAIKQHFQKRKGVAGYNNDVVQNFAKTALRMSGEIAAIDTSADVNNVIEEIISDNDGKPLAGSEANIREEIIKRAGFLRNPQPPEYARKLSALGYNMYLAGNISSALVNLTQLPIVTFPKLIAEFGFTNSLSMMTSMSKQYLKNLANPATGRDDNTTLTVPGINASLADVTIFTKDVLKDNGIAKLYATSLQRNAIRRTTSQELQEARREFSGKVGSTRDRVMLAANWAFQNSERANREIGIMAAYKLAIDKFSKLKAEGKLNKTTEQIQDLAIERALKITEEASGTALQELGPRWFQSGFGKIIGTFKRFVFSQVYLQYKLMFNSVGKVLPKNHKSDSSMPIDPDTGAPIDAIKFARRQLAFITIMSAAFAGARGVPGMGIASVLYDLGTDEDDPDYLNFDQWMKVTLGDVAHRGPLAHLLNIDMSNRIGFNGLLFRRDERAMEDLGFVFGTINQLGGPVLSIAVQTAKGVERMSDDTRQNPIFDGVQMIMPAAIRNPMKGMRYYIEGAVDKAGRPIVENVSLYNSVMQAVGFSATDVADAYEDSNILYSQKRNVENKRRGLLNKRFFAHYAGDTDGVREIDDRIRKFNQAKSVRAFKLQIGGDTKSSSLKMKTQEANKTYRDVIAPRAVQRRAAEAMGGLDIDE